MGDPSGGILGHRGDLSADNPLLAGADPSVWLADADVILVVDSQAPWMIAEGDCRQDCTVIQMGPDPLFSRYPVRGYRADINLAGETDEVFSLLEEALRPLQAARQQHVAERAAYTQNRIQQQKNQRDALLHASQTGAITKPWLSYCLGHLANQHRGRIVSELTTLPQFAGLTQAESYYQEALAGGLGEALPIALGLQLARREELIIAAVGDGSYLFANPAVCHHIAEVMKLPVLVVVGNNGGWGGRRGRHQSALPGWLRGPRGNHSSHRLYHLAGFRRDRRLQPRGGPVGFPGRRSPRRAGRSGIPHTHPPTKRAG